MSMSSPMSLQKTLQISPFYRATRCHVRFFAWILGGVTVYNRERVPPAGAVIVASNHCSHLDPPLLSVGVERELAFLARKTLFDNPLFSLLIRGLNAFPIDRDGNPAEAVKTFVNILAQDQAVVMFPEGTRSITGELQELKPGIGLIASRSGAPILPVYLGGTFDAWPKGKKIPGRAKNGFRVRFGELITVDSSQKGVARWVIEELKTKLSQLENQDKAEFPTVVAN